MIHGQNCQSTFNTLTQDAAEKMLCLIVGQSAGIDNLDGKILKVAVIQLSKPICHILNCSFLSGTSPEIWKQSKMITLLKDTKAGFKDQTADQLVCSQDFGEDHLLLNN